MLIFEQTYIAVGSSQFAIRTNSMSIVLHLMQTIFASSGSKPLPFWPGRFDAEATNGMDSQRHRGLDIWSTWKRSYCRYFLDSPLEPAIQFFRGPLMRQFWARASQGRLPGKMGRFNPINGKKCVESAPILMWGCNSRPTMSHLGDRIFIYQVSWGN